jgi:hypothetical protein
MLVCMQNQSVESPTVSLALDHLTLDSRLQSRKLHSSIVKEYSAVLRRGGTLPPVRVVRDSNDAYYLVDGHHREAACRQLNGLDQIEAEVIDGTFDDALWHSWGANRDHGLRRTQKETRQIVRAVLQHPKWRKKSNRAIARHVGCDHKTVAAIRCSLSGEIPKRRARATPGADSESGKREVLEACRLLAEAHLDRNCQFDQNELAVISNGCAALQRLLADVPFQPQPKQQPEDRSQGGTNE